MAFLIIVFVGIVAAFISITIPGDPQLMEGEKLKDYTPRNIAFVSVLAITAIGILAVSLIKTMSHIYLQTFLTIVYLVLNHVLIYMQPSLTMYIAFILGVSVPITFAAITHSSVLLHDEIKEEKEAERKKAEEEKKAEEAKEKD